MASRVFVRGAGLAGALLACSAHAGAGLRSGGDTLYSARVGHLTASDQWDGDGELRDNECRSEYSNTSHALEHGYSYYHTVYGQLGGARSACGGDSAVGLSDLRVGVRGRLNVYENDGSWELEAVVPLSAPDAGERRIGCGELGLAAALHKRYALTDALDVEGGASAHLWSAPLAHVARAYTGFGHKFARRWSWGAGLQGAAPVSDGAGDPEALISDCGTEGKVLRAVADLKYRQSDFLHLSCGLTQALWGEDSSRVRGMSCGFSYLWKD